MKKLLTTLYIITCLAACNKLPSANITTTVSTTTGDTVTIINNGITAVDTGRQVSCTIDKKINGSFFTMSLSQNPWNLLFLHIGEIPGPVNSIGTYRLSPVDSSSAYYLDEGNNFTETFTGGEYYAVDSVAVNITAQQGSTVIGSYQLWVSNATVHKTVTGNINCHSARVN